MNTSARASSSFVVTTLKVGQMGTNSYLLTDRETREALIVDPGDDPEYIMDHIAREGSSLRAIVATHGHFDHIMGSAALQLAYAVPFFIHTEDNFLVVRMQESAKHFLRLREVDPPPKTEPLPKDATLRVGKSVFQIIHTPGHTPGSVCLYNARAGEMFVGDTIFADGGVGRTDFSYSRPLLLSESITKILSYPADTTLYPGHGESTLIRLELQYHKGA